MNNTNRIEAIRTEIRALETVALWEPQVCVTIMHDRSTPITHYTDSYQAQARLDELCAELGRLADDA